MPMASRFKCAQQTRTVLQLPLALQSMHLHQADAGLCAEDAGKTVTVTWRSHL